MSTHPHTQSIFRSGLLWKSIGKAFLMLNPMHLLYNPVMLTVFLGSLITTIIWISSLFGYGDESSWFIGSVAGWLWFTLLFANFSEALAESRGKAQAESLRSSRTETLAKKLIEPNKESKFKIVPSTFLRKGDYVLVETEEIIPVDGEVIDGIASVDESAVTGESSPVIRESGGDRSAVTSGTRVLSDWLVIKATSNPGEGLLDRMIAMIEGAKRQKAPNEIALNILLAGMTLVFLIVCISLLPFSLFSIKLAGAGTPVSITILVALLVCLIPTTIGGLLPAIGISGVDRLIQRNVLALSGKAVETAGDVDVLLLDKTGTITLGNREAVEFVPLSNVDIDELAKAALWSSLADETPEGRSIVSLARHKYDQNAQIHPDEQNFKFIPFSAQTRMSGVNAGVDEIRKGAAESMLNFIRNAGSEPPQELIRKADDSSRRGETPLIVVKNNLPLGVIRLKDIVKGGMKARFAQLREMGIKTVMITGDNPLTAAAIAAESGVDDFLAQAKPEDKLKKICEYQSKGNLVAMTGDGTNDAPAMAQADVAVAMNTGTQPAREAANIIDLDSNPTKLIEIVEIGKQLLMTRGALTTFSIANDVAKYFAIIPAAFASTYPSLQALNFMNLRTPNSAILSAVIFNALIILALIPLAMHGIPYKPRAAGRLLRDNLLIYGLGGLAVPFVGIKLIDMLLGVFA